MSLITIQGSAAEGRIWMKQPLERTAAVNILRKQTRTVNKGQSSNLGIEPGLPTPCFRRQHDTKHHTGPQVWKDIQQ